MTRKEFSEWRQKDEIIKRCARAETEMVVTARRINYVKARLEKQKEAYHFANGFRAGLECALIALEDGTDLLGHSIEGEPTVPATDKDQT